VVGGPHTVLWLLSVVGVIRMSSIIGRDSGSRYERVIVIGSRFGIFGDSVTQSRDSRMVR
jgi:hypothetical protein